MRTANTPDIIPDIRAAVSSMERGGVILYPTDTVWGIGCDATCPEAVERVFALKRRSESKSLITLVSSIEMLRHYVAETPRTALDLIDSMAEGDRPLTLILPRACNLAPQVVADDGSAGFRITSERFSAALCDELGRPLVSTSANISGEPAPAVFSEIAARIIAGCNYVARYRRDDSAPASPSKIVKISPDGSITTLRS